MPGFPRFTRDEAAVWDVYGSLGEAARRSLYVHERVAAAWIASAHRGAAALATRLGIDNLK